MQLKKSTRIKDIYITKTILQISSENGYKINGQKIINSKIIPRLPQNTGTDSKQILYLEFKD